MKAFLFILTILTNQGELQMKAVEVEACPEKEGFFSTMEKLKTDGQFIEWNAICYDTREKVGA